MRLGLAMIAAASWSSADGAEALHFADRTLHFQPAPEDNEIRATFSFTCVATVPVTILSTRTSCGCTTATPSRTVHAPGQAGEVDAVFDIGNATGAVAKTITLTTDHPDDRTIVLTIAAQLPPAPSFDPQFVTWPVGADPLAKTISILLPLGCAQRLTGATSSNPRWTVAFAPGPDERSASLAITPASTAEKSGTAIQVLTASRRRFTVHALVMPAEGGSAPAGSAPGH